jgi:phosphatidylglycerophosphatase A
MLEKIKNIFIKIATLNSIGNLLLGGVMSTLLAIPFLYLLQFIYAVLPGLFHSLWVAIIFLCLISIYVALRDSRKSIVLHKFIGAMIAFYYVPLTLKIVVSGIILFYLCDYLIPLLIFKKEEQLEVGKIKQMIHLLIPSIASGIIVNIFFHFVLWIAH